VGRAVPDHVGFLRGGDRRGVSRISG
jgi:hypothetical protein